MEKVISVIVPVYNVDSYLPQCMDSILSQSYEALEVILIDDGSTDGSGALCDAYEKKDPRVRVIHQKNGGAASAKNAGLRIATGEYLTFVDSDDFLEPGAYLFMVSTLESYGADVVQSGFRNVFTDLQEERIAQDPLREYEAIEYLRRYTSDWTCALLWDKLYKRALFEGIFFEEGHIVDDEFFTYQGVMNAQKIVFAPNVIYNYRKRKSSVMLSPTSAQRIVMDRLDYLPKRRKTVISKFPQLRREYDLNFLDSMLYLAISPFATKESLLLEKELLKQYRRESGRTFPPKALWVGLLKLRFLPVKRLLKRRKEQPAANSTQGFFN